MPISLNELKRRAIARGYNLRGDVFEVKDWPIIKGFLAFEYGIKAWYRPTMRDFVSGANTPFDPSFTFENQTDDPPIVAKYSYGIIKVHAGLNLHTSETITTTSTAKVEVAIGGEWKDASEFTVNFDTQDSEIHFRYKPADSGNSITFSSPTFTSVYLFNSIPYQPGERTPAICDEAVCGLTILGEV